MFVAHAQVLRADDAETISPGEMAKAPYSLTGFLELIADHQVLNRDGALYKVGFYQEPGRAWIDQTYWDFLLEGDYTKDMIQLHFRSYNFLIDDYTGTRWDSVWQEAYAALHPGPIVTIDLGKRVMNWGKGYAFNPVAFVDRPKDPNDPDLPLEGFVVGRAEVIQSFEGPMRNAALTVVLLPVQRYLNNDFGAVQDEPVTNIAAKLYLLAWDTDFDLVGLADGTRSARYGFDFARNLQTNFEVHGEWATVSKMSQPVLRAQGAGSSLQATPGMKQAEGASWVLGLRYLTEGELTAITEYYHSDVGYSATEQSDYFRFVNLSYQQFLATGYAKGLQVAQSLQRAAYGHPFPGTNYAYVRLSQKDAFGWLYFTPGLLAMVNTDDQSSMTTLETLYTGITNLEVRLRYTVLQGGRYTEFADKLPDNRAELRVRYFF